MLDMPLEAETAKYSLSGMKGFNPSYAGYASGRPTSKFTPLLYSSFNPSYAGYASGRIAVMLPLPATFQVSILLMLDMPLEVCF